MARYLTKEGFQALQAEIERLWFVERPVVTASVTAAAEMGDRSENAEYIYGKKRMREIDAKLRDLRKKIEGVTIVDLATQAHFKDVRFGAVVETVDDDGVEKTFRLVDQNESDPGRGRISIQSPIGRALLGKKVGDHVLISLPKGEIGMEITALRYGAGEP